MFYSCGYLFLTFDGYSGPPPLAIITTFTAHNSHLSHPSLYRSPVGDAHLLHGGHWFIPAGPRNEVQSGQVLGQGVGASYVSYTLKQAF
jgi:hypothetical protein